MTTLIKVTTLAIALATFAFLAGCNSSTPAEPSAETKPAADSTASIPSSLFAASAPADVMSLIDAKTTAKAGDTVVFEARIGGRVAPFVEERAIFAVADAALLSCDQLHGDRCKFPWDYCCEPRDNLLKNMATVQVVDANGHPLKMSLESKYGLEPLRTIVVRGVVASVEDGGVFVVNADEIFVREG